MIQISKVFDLLQLHAELRAAGCESVVSVKSDAEGFVYPHDAKQAATAQAVVDAHVPAIDPKKISTDAIIEKRKRGEKLTEDERDLLLDRLLGI